MHLLVLIGLLVSLAATQAQANYPSARKNANLREEVEADPNRLVPVTKHFAFGVDGEAYYRMLGNQDFYHGIGYWVQARSEVAPTPFFRLNLRSIFYAGSCSYGYVEPSDLYHALSLTGIYPEPVLGAEVKVVGLDLGRHTRGQGHQIQHKEYNGALLTLTYEHAYLSLRAEGTGALVLGDDTYVVETSFFDGYLGAGAVYWPGGREQDFLPEIRAPYYYATSTQTFDWFRYGIEVGQRKDAKAALVLLGARGGNEEWTVDGSIEGRRYEDRFAETWVGRVEQQYVSYDQYDKAYTNAINVFAIDDEVDVGAAHLNFHWRPSHAWRFHAMNEIGIFDYKAVADETYYYYRFGAEHCPVEERDDCIVPFVSNKVLRDGFARPPSAIARNNEPLFKMVNFFGVEARFQF